MKRIKKSPEFLLESGLLFEINRKVLHPLGLALEVVLDDDSRAVFGDLWDCRDDPEGILFSPDTFIEGKEKLDKYMELRGAKSVALREKTIGYVVQEK